MFCSGFVQYEFHRLFSLSGRKGIFCETYVYIIGVKVVYRILVCFLRQWQQLSVSHIFIVDCSGAEYVLPDKRISPNSNIFTPKNCENIVITFY